MFYIIIITFFVLFIIVFSGTSKNLNRELLDYDALGVVWIIIPLIILLLIGVPSLMLLYLVEEKLNWLFSVKIRGTSGTDLTMKTETAKIMILRAIWKLTTLLG